MIFISLFCSRAHILTCLLPICINEFFLFYSQFLKSVIYAVRISTNNNLLSFKRITGFIQPSLHLLSTHFHLFQFLPLTQAFYQDCSIVQSMSDYHLQYLYMAKSEVHFLIAHSIKIHLFQQTISSIELFIKNYFVLIKIHNFKSTNTRF